MAVVGNTPGLPALSRAFSSSLFITLLPLLLAVGIGWLLVDYGRILLLHRKMVSRQQDKADTALQLNDTAPRPLAASDHWQYTLATGEQAMDLF